MIENGMLFTTLCSYPDINESLISISSAATFIKLLLIKVWVAELIIGIIICIYKSRHKESVKNETNTNI